MVQQKQERNFIQNDSKKLGMTMLMSMMKKKQTMVRRMTMVLQITPISATLTVTLPPQETMSPLMPVD